MPTVSPEVYAIRCQVGSLLMAVLDEETTALSALTHWPGIQTEDPSVQVAYQMLWHFEADEEEQQQQEFYMDAQWELLFQTARYLLQGDALPGHLLAAYREGIREHQTTYYQEGTPWQAPAAGTRQWLQKVRSYWVLSLKSWRDRVAANVRSGARKIRTPL
ncbi:MAG: hypothetical protein AB7P76_12870 [Candidatus Melainabacteria bacterium]